MRDHVGQQDHRCIKNNLSRVAKCGAIKGVGVRLFASAIFFCVAVAYFNFTANLNSRPGLSRKSRAALCR